MTEITPSPLTPNRKTALLVAAIVALTLPAMFSLFRTGGYWESHDGVFHLYRLLALEQAWHQGQLYPRIFPEFAFGYGFAVLNFYGPLTYYVALAGRLVGLSPIIAMKATYALSYPLAAIGMWQLARTVWGKAGNPNEGAGIVAAAVYTYVPYHLADVQLRGALAESWAFVWWGWLLWAAWRGRFVTFMFALAGLVLTHNLSVVLIAFPLAVWTLIALSKAADKGRYLLGMIGATASAAALTAFYWFPVLLESRYVMISQDVGGLGFARHLQPLAQWIAATADYHYFPYQGVAAEHPLSWAQVALLGVALIVGVGALRHHRAIWFFGWGTLALSLLLLSPLSYPFWERLVFPFGLIQYPWRWLGITALVSGVVVGGAVAFLPRRFLWGGYALMAVGVGWLAWSGLAYLPYTERAVDSARYPVSMWEEDAANGQVGATWTAEFLPLTVTEQRWALARAPETVRNVGERSPLEMNHIIINRWQWDFSVTATEAGALSFPRYAYPSMAVEIDGVSHPLSARGDLGLATVMIPQGIHSVKVQLYPLADKWWLDLVFWAIPFSLFHYIFRRFRFISPILLTITFAFVMVRNYAPAIYGENIYSQSVQSENQQFGSQATLIGWQSNAAHPGELLPVSLKWFNLEQSDQNYVTFLHLTPLEGGAPLAQHDSQPNMGTVPTTRWLAGQLVEDLHLLEIPADLPTGQYQLWAGMYAVVDGQAVPIPGDSGERRLLGAIEVE